MGKMQVDPYFRSSRAQVLGAILGVCLIAPPLIRLGEGHWTGVDWVFVIAGAAFTIFWLSMAVLGWRSRRSGTHPER
ncbi:hypothetical protein [Pseudarthrobacter chlorophenolicus]|uniref:hypothetical protein n=1 Tax=Pseudarthrobacter chlorophenolicus TaxID=85085 RepID=UPI0005F29251|nr:hypothetical protein [Pseudarthrobacter chlorophenolicus]